MAATGVVSAIAYFVSSSVHCVFPEIGTAPIAVHACHANKKSGELSRCSHTRSPVVRPRAVSPFASEVTHWTNSLYEYFSTFPENGCQIKHVRSWLIRARSLNSHGMSGLPSITETPK